MEEIIAAVGKLGTGAKKTNKMVTALAGDLEQQRGAIEDLAKATESISEMSQSISAATEELTILAQQLQQMVEQFRITENQSGVGLALPQPAQQPPRAGGWAESRHGRITAIALKKPSKTDAA